MVRIIDTNNWLYKNLPKFIYTLLIKTYSSQGLVQFDDDKKTLTICGSYVRWLERIEVNTISRKRANEIMFGYFNNKYPEYDGWVQLF